MPRPRGSQTRKRTRSKSAAKQAAGFLNRLEGGRRAHGSTAKAHHTAQPPPGLSQCHPAVSHTAHGCLPLDVLRRAAQALGVRSTLHGHALRSAIAKKLRLKDDVGERSLLMALPIEAAEKTNVARRTLRPAAPATWKEDPDMWLDSNDIANVMNQYEEAFPHFEFMGPFPIDFAAPDPYRRGGGGADATEQKCLMNEICELRVQKALSNGTKAVGIIYNLDPHFKGGSHWVANYVDIVGHKCYYFDSYGMKPPVQVERFMKWLTTQDPQMRLEYNARRLQYRNTECGVYCLYFIIRMLMGDSFVEITRRKPKDDDMFDLRDWLYST